MAAARVQVPKKRRFRKQRPEAEASDLSRSESDRMQEARRTLERADLFLARTARL